MLSIFMIGNTNNSTGDNKNTRFEHANMTQKETRVLEKDAYWKK